MRATCKYCNKEFSRNFNLKRHLREVHRETIEPIVYDKKEWGYKCLEPYCDVSFQKGQFLIHHLEKIHLLRFQNETIVFANTDEFTNWKESIEEGTCTRYVRKKNKNNVTYFNCNHSKAGHDFFQINSICTSQIKVRHDNDGKIIVHFQKNHYGYDGGLTKIKLQNYEKEKIATNKLIIGVPAKTLVQMARDNTRENIGEQLKSKDFLTMTEFQDGKLQHENDPLSLDFWVQECKEIPQNDIEFIFENSNESSPAEKLNNKMNEVFCKLKNTNFDSLDDSTIEKIHYHLSVIEGIINKSSQKIVNTTEDNDLILKEDSNKRYIEPQVRLSSTKKKKMASNITELSNKQDKKQKRRWKINLL